MVSAEHIATNIDKIGNEDKLDEFIQILSTWFSPSFPIGSYTFSHGLESMIENKLIKNKLEINDYIKSILYHGTCKNEIILIKFAYKGLDLNDFALSLCSSKERKIETLAMGNNFRKILKESWQYELPENIVYPVAIGIAANFFQLPLKLTIISFLQSFISNLINICVKHIPIGQKIGQDCLINSFSLIREIVKKNENCTLDDIGGICFNADIHSIKHENLKTRIYKT